MWDSKTIANKISSESVDLDLQPNQIHLALFSADTSIGIGSDGNANTVLLLPGQTNVLGFQTEFASYDPWSDLVVFETGKHLKGVSILRCNIEIADTSTIEAAAAIFYGLIDLQTQFGETGKAIWQMKNLFENRLKFELSDQLLTGIFGELLILNATRSPALAVHYWHSDTDDKYDFSGNNFRLEVKTTLMNERNHHFSSHQIPGEYPDKTFVASIKLVKVEAGDTLLKLVNDISARLDKDCAQKLKNIVIKTLQVPIELVNNFQIDVKESLKLIQLYTAQSVPCPTKNKGVISMDWYAELGAINTFIQFDTDFFTNNQN
jgi:hypothetical protein